MAKTRSQPVRRGARGWLGAALLLLFLVVAGFAFGLVAGVVWEEPQLAFAYFSGETEEVAWGSPATRAVPDVAASAAAPPAAPGGIADPKTRRERAAAPASVPVTSLGGFSVQVGAFSSSRAADGLAKDLRAKGFEVYVSPGTKAGESRWRVRVGPVATRAEAEGTAKRLKQVEKLPTWILQEDAS